MSMCLIGFRAGGHTHVSYLHYARGVLDWRKYHADQEVSLGEHALKFDEGTSNRTYFEEIAALHGVMKSGFDPAHADGCERMAGEGGFWTCEDAKQQMRWRTAMRARDDSNEVPLDDCALFLDFDARHATVRDRQFVEWERFLPDGWTWEEKEIGKD